VTAKVFFMSKSKCHKVIDPHEKFKKSLFMSSRTQMMIKIAQILLANETLTMKRMEEGNSNTIG